MKFITENSIPTIYFSERFFIEFHCDWLQVFGEYNWYNFHFLHFYVERDEMVGGYEFVVYLLGFGVRARLNDKEMPEYLKKSIEEVGSGSALKYLTLWHDKTYRHGQAIFNFLEHLKLTGKLSSHESSRMGDPFHISDEEFEALWEEFNDKSKSK